MVAGATKESQGLDTAPGRNGTVGPVLVHLRVLETSMALGHFLFSLVGFRRVLFRNIFSERVFRAVLGETLLMPDKPLMKNLHAVGSSSSGAS